MSESLRSSANVDFYFQYPRKYWSINNCSITVRERSTLGGVRNKRFTNEYRYFLYEIDPLFEETFDSVLIEDSNFLQQKGLSNIYIMDNKAFLKELELNKRISIRIKEYEKEFFYLKCLFLGKKPQLVLRTLLRLSKIKKREEIFTSPETIFEMILISSGKPILRKDVKFVW